ncbi:winged helix-turn-helix transcriptional regulator [Micromonospora mangrovi]|uniref:Helix-turn-helix domain-containing protein n=2 Tax=Micromonospora TaxID=1873 RepID=A0AAU7MCE4_9ACTN
MTSEVTPDAAGYCPYVQHAMEMLGRRWTASVLRVLLARPDLRFGEIRCAVPGLSDRLLTERLGELEREGVIHRSDDGGGHVTYRPTAKGEALRPLFGEVQNWADRWRTGDLGPRPGRLDTCRRPPC